MGGKRRTDDRSWFDLEVQGSNFQDTRLHRRFAILLEKLWAGMGQTIPFACQDWALTKAVYRFLSNDGVSEHDILSGHFDASAARFAAAPGPILVLQDTTTFSCQREHPELVGYTGTSTTRDRFSKSSVLTQCDILMHSSLVVTADGLPPGLAAVKFWTRKPFKGRSELKRHINPTRVPIEQKESWHRLMALQSMTIVAKVDESQMCVATVLAKPHDEVSQIP